MACSKVAWDGYLSVAHLSQGVLYLVLAVLPNFKNALIPVTLTVPTGRPGLNTTFYEVEQLFFGNPVAVVSTFFFITAIFHAIRFMLGKTVVEWELLKSRMGKVMTDGDEEGDSLKQPSLSEKEKDAIAKVDRQIETQRGWRWFEYSLSSTLMMFVIALVSGITDLYAIGAIGLANLGMILLGASGDKVEHYPGKMRAFWYGCVVGLLAWMIVFAQVIILGVRAGGSQIPFVLSISTTLFVLFWCFSVSEYVYIQSFLNQNPFLAVLRRERVEFAYQVLSAVAKTTLGALCAASMLTLA